ncbi:MULTISPECIES: helix-turn-helix domain-containing protein [Halobacteriovorax]|uniref:XRE family transcriptional regulator n=1 Tax=Halobacteriovorax vibrionivorans TaxID=2152716 RepID=A0ABY0IH91_9BACT|nr:MULTISPECIES: helix-turn-helix transcriptional regulator [Halobacteriovorax]AYF45222.1 hypothetical protein BALOs_2224 [Halobacteriovorax sp. BALOs_7]RZF22311.1 XRE family transcriptional regulator [Halobacteriovorax vibrionivorans]TGD48563.1 XRE family transcriptional regulator [Halobacteriovorax sp. Y22]
MKEKRVFENIAKLIKQRRRSLSPKVSQQGLSYRLGYKNGQFISNIERGLCSVPLRSLNSICDVLKVSKEELRETLLKDYAETIDNYFAEAEGEQEESSQRVSSDNGKEIKRNFEFASNYVV